MADGTSIERRLKRRRAEYDPDDIQATIERLESDGERISCMDCGKANNFPYLTISQYPDPGIEDSEDWPIRCHECYAALLEDVTTLSEAEARSVALRLGGASRSQIADVIGRAVGTVDTHLTRAREKERSARLMIDEAENTVDVLSYL